MIRVTLEFATVEEMAALAVLKAQELRAVLVPAP